MNLSAQETSEPLCNILFCYKNNIYIFKSILLSPLPGQSDIDNSTCALSITNKAQNVIEYTIVFPNLQFQGMT